MFGGVDEGVPDREEDDAGGGDAVETVDVVPERDVELDPVVFVAEHVSLATDTFSLSANNDNRLLEAGKVDEVSLVDSLQRKTLIAVTQLLVIVTVSLSLLLTLLLQLL